MKTNLDNNIFNTLAEAVLKLNISETQEAARQALQIGVPPMAAITNGLAEGMRAVGEKFSCGIYFVPEVLVASRAFYAGMDILRPSLPSTEAEGITHVVIGVVRGDVHDIGKNIVKLFWEAEGYNVVDLGKNVSTEKFLSVIDEKKPLAVALSTLMTTTLQSMEQTVTAIREYIPENTPKIIIGGASVTQSFADSICADFYGANGNDAALGLKNLLGKSGESEHHA